MSSVAAQPVSQQQSPRKVWIISPAWDLLYLVATPVLIVPLVILARDHWSPEAVSLAVISFASLGHHLPGFMRAYGDRELFTRFRWRFLLAPPLLFALALLFSPPDWLASWLELPWTHLHGLELILLVWGTWHGLMQTYGFMRIYDVKLGETAAREARLDHALCLVIFVAGVVFSDSRMFGIANAMWQAGLPVFGPEWLTGARWLVGGLGAVVMLLYLTNLATRWRARRPLNFAKLLLALTTGGFYWYTGRLSTNLLIGLAMFEIYHAVQYYAIVWIYNRRLFERAGEKFGWLGFLFRDRPTIGKTTMLGIYLALIAAYSSIRYFTGDASSYIYTSDGNNAYQLLFALFVTSSLLHFYFDGFIWKVSDRRTQENLTEDEASLSRLELSVPALKHAAKWSVFIVLAAGLLWSERNILRAETQQREQAVREGLMALTPELPEVQLLRSRAALEAGKLEEASRLATRAVALRPHSAQIHANAAVAFLAAGENEKVRELLEPIVAEGTQDWQSVIDLALAYEQLEEIERAETMLNQAIHRQPELTEPKLYYAEFLRRQQRPYEAMQQMRIVVEANPGDYQTRLALGLELASAGKSEQARQVFQALAVDLQKAVSQKPNNLKHQRQLGEVYYQLEDWAQAIPVFEACIRLQPRVEEHYVNLATAHDARGDWKSAAETIRAGLKQLPESQQLKLALEMLAP